MPRVTASLLVVLASSPAFCGTTDSLWVNPSIPPDPALAALYQALPVEAAKERTHSLTIRSSSAEIYQDLTFYGPEQLATPSVLQRGSAEELILRFISALEAPKGYDDYFRGVKLPPPLPLTQMSLGDVMLWQAAGGARRNGYKPASVAVGGYQVITKTLAHVAEVLNLDPSVPFDAATQDQIGLHLLHARGFGKFLRGEISIDQMGDNLAHEWAALPMLTGPDAAKSAYWRDGVNRALVSTKVFRAVLEEALLLAHNPVQDGAQPLIILAQVQP